MDAPRPAPGPAQGQAQAAPSHVLGARTTPLLDMTIGQALDAAAARWGEREALVAFAQGRRMTWRELHAAAEAFAAGLLDLGLEPGERVGIWSLNRAEWLVTHLAAAKAGLVLVTINPAYREAELEFALRKVQCAALVIAPPFKASDYAAMVVGLAPEIAAAAPGEWRAARLPDLRLLVQMDQATLTGAIAFADVSARGESADPSRLRAVAAAIKPSDPSSIQFTSGTTGRPKGVTLSHASILNNGYIVGTELRLGPDDRVCVPVPLYHCFGLVIGNLAAVALGATLVYPGEGFDAETTLAAVAQERCTALYGVPTMFIAVLEHPRFAAFDVGSLRTGIMGGAPCPIEVMRRVTTRLNMREVAICYGMTETSPASFQSDPDDEIERRVTSVGRVLPHTEAKLVDDEGRTVARGQEGEICVRGYLLMQGYWGDPDATAAAIDADGFMHTGDLGRLDAEGYCNITGRKSDMVIRGGENIAPREIEELLYTHPGVRDVQVFGVPDPRVGEELCAWIIAAAPGLEVDEVRGFCSGRIARHKVPRYIRLVDAFPMTVTGKIQKFAMRAAMAAELGLVADKTA